MEILLVTLQDKTQIEVRAEFRLASSNVGYVEALRRIEQVLMSGTKFVKVQRISA